MSEQIKDKYIGTFLLHALGDTIGYKNGFWEFFDVHENDMAPALEKLCEFIDLGGINDINLQNWRVSDDTLLHMAVGKSLLENYKSYNELLDITKKNFIISAHQMGIDHSEGNSRGIGQSTLKYIVKMHEGEDWKNFKYDKNSVGNGVAMRSLCIGLAFFGDENREKLINYVLDTGLMTHPNPIGILGGLSTALFTAFAIEGIHIYKWPYKLLEIIGTELVSNRMNDKKTFLNFINTWKTYLEMRFVDGKPIKTKTHTNIIHRNIYYEMLRNKMYNYQLGSNGHDTVVIAYDSLIDADACWEKLVIYSMLNNFDTDTIGSIAGGLYGVMYGTTNIPKKNLSYLEFSKELNQIGEKMYKKYYLNEK